MNFEQVHIDGYGRFSNVDVQFQPGVTIIVGPNERGKSTLRSYLSDMLYGQKRSGQDAYEESNLLRRPWQDHERYGGTLTYALSDGRRITVERCFDRDAELLVVRDAAMGEDITQSAGGLDFAARQLGLAKEVYVNAATIGHFSLEGLGGRDSLNQIREKLQSLADTGEEWHSSESALELLQERIHGIGQPGERGKPLPETRARLARLEEERAAAYKLREEAATLRETLRGLTEQASQFELEEARLRHELTAWDRHARVLRARRVRKLHEEIEALTKRMFAFSGAREFPVHHEGQVQQTYMRKQAADEKLTQSRRELHQTDRRIDEERAKLADAGLTLLDALPEDLEAQFSDLSAEVQRIEGRMSDIERALEGTEQRLQESQQRLASLPDFSRIAADPIEWISQLGSSFDVAIRARDEERESLKRIQRDVDERRAAIADNHALFKDHKNFPELAREYELERRVSAEQAVGRGHTLQAKRNLHADVRASVPDFITLCGVCAVGMLALAGGYLYTGVDALAIAAGAVLLAALYFGGRLIIDRRRLEQLAAEIRELEQQTATASDTDDTPKPQGVVSDLMDRAGCETIRELEARHDQYMAANAELIARVDLLREQERKTEEAEERIPSLLARFRDTFDRLGVQIEGESQVKQAAGDAIGKYQEYREAKRGIADCHTASNRHQTDLKKLAEEKANAQSRLEQAEQRIRELLAAKTGGRPAEDVAASLRSLRTAMAERKEREARISVLEEQSVALSRQVKADEFDASQRDQEFNRLLAQAGVKSIDEWRAGLDEAKQYATLKEQRDGFNRDRDQALQGEDLNVMLRLADESAHIEEPSQSKEALEEAAKRIEFDIRRIRDDMHRVQLDITERLSRGRPLNEIEEEHAWALRRAAELQLELDAASYAMAIIEEVSRDKHARLAPKLESRASALLAQITSGAYESLRIGPDLSITLAMPGKAGEEKKPDKTLSKGTVDQVYLAIRMALVETLSENSEPVPMLLDDPFANYDDERLRRTMELMRVVGEQRQVLIFTCREDVVRTGQAAGVPVLEL
ncbi:MAG: AAA family ATPase [Candidatus Hydrogenedens sp.]|nr:AAA family ATPase [Candidatus Hydrogenedens sp.]